jgi:hypothetical protein
MNQGFRVDRESIRSCARRFARIAVATLGVAGFTVAGLSGALAHDGHGWDDDVVFAPSGGFVTPGGLDDSGWDDVVISGISGSGGSDDSVWHDQWDDD